MQKLISSVCLCFVAAAAFAQGNFNDLEHTNLPAQYLTGTILTNNLPMAQIVSASGTNGTSGTNGSQGIQGISGTNGTSGTNGATGLQGNPGVNGLNLISGVVTNQFTTNTTVTLSTFVSNNAAAMKMAGADTNAPGAYDLTGVGATAAAAVTNLGNIPFTNNTTWFDAFGLAAAAKAQIVGSNYLALIPVAATNSFYPSNNPSSFISTVPTTYALKTDATAAAVAVTNNGNLVFTNNTTWFDTNTAGSAAAKLATNGYPWGSLYAPSTVTNLTSGQITTVVAAAGVTNLTSAQVSVCCFGADKLHARRCQPCNQLHPDSKQRHRYRHGHFYRQWFWTNQLEPDQLCAKG